MEYRLSELTSARNTRKKVLKMTLDEAIKHLEETLSDKSHKWSCESCKQEHEQLLEWLKELKAWREIGKTCVDKGICVPIILNGKIVPDMLQGWKYEQKNNT